MSLEKMYYKLSKEDFDSLFKSLRNSPDAIVFNKNDSKEFFYTRTVETSDALHALKMECVRFENIVNTMSSFAKKQLVISFLVDEVLSTNKIEDIHSTKHDVFYTLNNLEKSKDKKVKSIARMYSLLLTNGPKTFKTLEDIRETYDSLLEGNLSKEDKPDGTFFRKHSVSIVDGSQIIENGIEGEENINKAMEFFLSVYNSDMEPFEKMILCHFILETIHPYYDGNGRLGRFLFANGVLSGGYPLLGFLISKSFLDQRHNYYKAFEAPKKYHEFGCINEFVVQIATILKEGIASITKGLEEKLHALLNVQINQKLSKKEKLVYSLLLESSFLSTYGISNEEIMKETGISKRSLFYALDSFKKEGILEDAKVGKTLFHKIK